MVRSATVASIVIALLLAAGGGCGVVPVPTPPGGAAGADQLESLPVVPRPRDDGTYRRAYFGKPWADIEHSGCRQRADVLTATWTAAGRTQRDAQAPAATRWCREPGGTLTPARPAPSPTCATLDKLNFCPSTTPNPQERRAVTLKVLVVLSAAYRRQRYVSLSVELLRGATLVHATDRPRTDPVHARTALIRQPRLATGDCAAAFDHDDVAPPTHQRPIGHVS